VSEPDIATLARRLAEQNNVDWRTLSGTGPDGKIVERDVLDYLARVMAGEEAVNPTPEPLPEGMEAWPDQDAPAYFKPNGHSQSAQSDGAAQVVDDAADDLLTDLAEMNDDGMDLADSDAGASEETFGASAGDAWEQPADTFSAAVDVDAQTGIEPAEDVFAEPATDAAASDDMELSDDIFLFDDEDDTFDAAAADTGFAAAEPAPAWQQSDTPAWGTAAETAQEFVADAFEEADPDDALLVADDDDDVVADGAARYAADPAHGAVGFASDLAEDLAADVSADLEAGLGAELHSDLGSDFGAAAEQALDEGVSDHREIFAASVESYDQEFTTPSEQFEDEADLSGWGSSDLSDLSDETPVMSDASVEEGGDLPDLWASETQADSAVEDLTVDLTEPEAEEDAAVAWGEGYGAVDVDAAASSEAGVDEADADDLAAAADELDSDSEAEQVDATGDAWSDAVTGADDVVDLEQAEALDEQDAVADLEALDGQPEVPAAALAGLPFMRTGNVMRRHVDLSALANAQLAAGMELGHDEPLSPAPFLLRAVAKAAAELGSAPGQVALAELEGEVRYRRVDDAANRSFGSLVDELTGQGQEEDEIGLVAVDLSAFDMDELLLDLDAPAVTLGRVLYDTQRGAHRSTLTMSGDLPLTEGAKLLARVAELLEAPIRLLL